MVQDDADPHSEDTEPNVGEVGAIYGDELEGPHVKLKSDVVGHVQSVAHDE
ncbi:DUF2196 domain-containing protein [Natrinema ejinorense]|uniref:DUF2196 domain-containing protein n=1 Tax=Natrinema ejinorense TaxID=373386 RepID=A0A2A5R0D1_9EURY|nr:DUF2196 domain-containing protein [Natrinema ejinorense]PCR92578.1 DUF2196 domain-containing protein [Natrinema ejinorense]